MMETNTTELSTMIQVIELFHDTVNISESSSVVPVKDLYEDYRLKENYKFLVYKIMAYILGVLIILSNLSVVVSSGLILRKGQKPKSTYILLGNVSLAETIVGFSIVYGLSTDNTLNNSATCIFQIGMLVCPAMVSIFSVGFIAIERYIYILHGLYFERWFNTTRVRIGMLLIWLISIILSFLPATGWVNRELALTRCFYVALFPGSLILLNCILGLIPILVVAVLYTFILVKALQTIKTINNSFKKNEVSTANNEVKMRMNRCSVNIGNSNGHPAKCHLAKGIKRSASFTNGTAYKPKLIYRFNSNENLFYDGRNRIDSKNFRENTEKQSKIQYESDFSVWTVESIASIRSLSIDQTNNQPNRFRVLRNNIKSRKIREPNKWRAIKVVLLTSGSFIFTWVPFFITVMFYVLCEEKLTNPKCIRLRALIGGPLAILACVNSVLNPLIYAWWHKGFQRSAKAYYKQYLQKYVCYVVR